MNPVVQAPWHLVVDLSPESGQAAERRLDMAAGATKSVVEVEVAECRIKVVAPHQADHAPAEPDAFRVSARAVDDLGGFDELVGFPLIILGRVSGIGRGRLAGLVRGGGAALGENPACAE